MNKKVQNCITQLKEIDKQIGVLLKEKKLVEHRLINNVRGQKFEEKNEQSFNGFSFEQIYIFDNQCRYIYVSTLAANRIGFTPAQMIGKHWRDLDLSPEIMLPFEENFKKVLKTGITLIAETKSDHKLYNYFLYKLVPIWDETNHVFAVLCLVKDITDRTKVEEALKESNEKFRKAFEYASIGMALVTPEGRWLKANQSLCQIVGFSKMELLTMNFQDIIHPEDQEITLKYKNLLLSGKICSYQLEKRYLHKLGKTIWVRASVSLIRDHQDNPLYFIYQIQDITRSKQAEWELQLSEQRFAKVFKVSPNLIFISRLEDGKYIEVNDSIVKITGYTREEMLGRTAYELNIWVSDKDREKITEILKQKQSLSNFEFQFRIKSGAIRTGLLSAELLEINGQMCILGVVNDITERKKFEEEMLQVDRLNLVGQLAAGLGHEVRNPLTTVRGFLQLLGKKKECAQYNKYYELMIQELDRASSIISEFLSLARTKPVDLKMTSLNRILESLYPLIESNALLTDKQVEMHLKSIPGLFLDEKGIRQMILNIAQNGLESMDTGGKLLLKTYLEDGEAVLAIRDEGPGIPAEVLDKLGTPFFTTKEKGTGLGLATCYSIAERHNATIKIDTSSRGTTFFIKFKL